MTKTSHVCKMSDSEIKKILKLLVRFKSMPSAVNLMCKRKVLETNYDLEICIDYDKFYLTDLSNMYNELVSLIGEDRSKLLFSKSNIWSNLTKESVREFLIQNKFV